MRNKRKGDMFSAEFCFTFKATVGTFGELLREGRKEQNRP
jgi:hypothetical protein